MNSISEILDNKLSTSHDSVACMKDRGESMPDHKQIQFSESGIHVINPVFT